MKQLIKSEFEKCTGIAETVSLGGVYVRSVVNGHQTGDIFTDGRGSLVWHRCGFAWLLGECSEEFLSDIDRLRTAGGRRLILFSDDKAVKQFFENRGADIGQRLYFEYGGSVPAKENRVRDNILSGGYSVREIDPELFGRLDSRVVPRLFWEDAEEFLRSGRGFCIMSGNDPAAWAFAASLDGRECDIGVEAAEAHRGKGLAYAAALMTLNSALEAGMKPVWACDGGNAASRGLARKLGFEPAGECFRIR